MNSTDLSFTGRLFDGKTAVGEEVALHVGGGNTIWLVRQQLPASAIDATTLRLTEPFSRAPLLILRADGSHLELSDGPAAYSALTKAGVAPAAESGMVAALARDGRKAVLALAFLASMVAALYVWLLPSLAATVVPMVPASWKAAIGDSAMEQLDATLFTPSTLPDAKTVEIHQRFYAMTKSEPATYKLHMRHFKRGPNAMALPGNHIVLTDELVELVDGDVDVIMGVLAHELGHLKHEHGLRKFVQGSALLILGSALIGDYSSILATAPVTLAQLQYSREFEAEADRYSHKLMCAKRQDASKTAVFFEKLNAKYEADGLMPTFLSSHPDSVNRAQFFKSKC